MPARHAPGIAMSTPAPKEIYNWNVYITATLASMGAFIFGYDLAFIGTTITLKPFMKDFHLTHATQSQKDAFAANIISLLQAGCFFGALAVAPLGDKLGRKPSLFLAGILFCIGSLMQTVSCGHVWAMFLGRGIGGLVSLRTWLLVRFLTSIPGSWSRQRHGSSIHRRSISAFYSRSTRWPLRD
jgi:MFS family permease